MGFFIYELQGNEKKNSLEGIFQSFMKSLNLQSMWIRWQNDKIKRNLFSFFLFKNHCCFTIWIWRSSSTGDHYPWMGIFAGRRSSSCYIPYMWQQILQTQPSSFWDSLFRDLCPNATVTWHRLLRGCSEGMVPHSPRREKPALQLR